MPERLIRFESELIGDEYLTDFLRVVAYNIEGSMIDAGAVPGKDYTFKDLYELAMPMAVAKARKGKLNWMANGLEGQLIPG